MTAPEEVHPSSLDELVKVVQRALKENRHIKAVGSRHSMNKGIETDGIAVRLTKLTKVLKIDKLNKLITVEAGIILKDLFKEMDKHELAFLALPNIEDITLGGAVANSTHGTCNKCGSFSDLVEEITVVTGNSEQQVLTVNRKDEKQRHYFEGLVASFGTLGIFYSITMRCVEAYNSVVTLDGFPLSEKIDKLDK